MNPPEPLDESVVEALLAAIAATPDNPSLRLHVAKQFEAAQRFSEAWEHAYEGLRIEPASVALLSVAATVGSRCGRESEAAGYQAILDALRTAGDSVAVSSPPPPPPPPTEPEPAQQVPDSRDDELRVPLAQGVPDSVDDLVDIWNESEATAEPLVGEISRDRVMLSDVAGMRDVKERLQTSFLNPMRNPEMQAAFGKSMRGGLLLWGPPGCGKTYIAKAVAGELGANFYSIGLSDVLDMWIGSSERNITEVFETARRNSPCVLFLDEVDAIGQKRTQLRGGGGAMRGVVNQLLQEMDGATSDNEGVFVLGATNHPWDVDSALLRPGRFDRSLLVLPPDAEARKSILDMNFGDRPTDNLNLDKIAKATAGLSGADLMLVSEHATELAMEASIAKGAIQPITMRDLSKAVRAIKPSYEPWVDAARNYATFNNQSGAYDDLLVWLKGRKR